MEISSERIDDIPVIVEWLKQMEIAKCIDQKLSPPHGNHEGMSYGQLSVLLLTYIAQIAANGGVYCFPVPMSGQHPQYLKQWVLDLPAQTVEIRLPRQDQLEPPVGKGFEVELGKFWGLPETNKLLRWHERYLVVYSQSLAASKIHGQQQRINKAQTALDKLAKKPGDDQEQLSYKVENILKRYRVNDFFLTTIIEETLVKTRHIGRGRPSKNSPTEEVTSICLQLHLQQIDDAIKLSETLAGWRLYVTNAPTTRLTLPQAVMYYRDEWLLERGFHRFKRGSLPALPIYFQNEDRITGLMFILNIALRVFTLIEFVVRLALEQTQQSLAGLYDGNPKRKTNRPSAEQMLKAFCNLTLYFLPDSTIFITPLSDLQKQILSLMKMPESLYQLEQVQSYT